MDSTYSGHVSLLEFAAQGHLHFSRSDQFMDWAVRSLFTHLQASHISIALYDSVRDIYPIQHSAGALHFPDSLIALDRANPLVQWFGLRQPAPHFLPHPHRPVTRADFKSMSWPIAQSILREMERYRIEVCAKIQIHDRLAGYLLIGPKENGKTYTESDILYFQALANNMAIEIERDEYYQLSHFDPLTGLLNRLLLDQKLPKMIEAARNAKTPFALALMDIDNFKMMNDSYGHLTGDDVLRIAAAILRQNMRQSDLVFRYGGEEFLSIIGMETRDPGKMPVHEYDFRAHAYSVVERVRKKFESGPVQCANHSLKVTISVGLTFYDGKSEKTPLELINEADQALYLSKKNGKNRTTLHQGI